MTRIVAQDLITTHLLQLKIPNFAELVSAGYERRRRDVVEVVA